MIRALGRAARAAVLVLSWAAIAHAAWPPVYAFPPPGPFAGPRWHDPYAGVDDGGVWLRANFHAHSRKAGGLLGPRTAPLERVRAAYRELDYDLPAISNYMTLTPPGPGEDLYLPAYEHGYGIRKWHHGVVGADRVDWLDFPLFQTASTKQYLIDRLRRSARLVWLNHPQRHGAFGLDEMAELTGYDGIEIRSHYAEAVPHWDAALSAGRRVWGVCTDDTRKYLEPRHSGIGYVLVHARERSEAALVDALRGGRFVAVYAPDRRAPNGFVSQQVANGRLRVRLREPADALRVIGQGGALRWSDAGVDRVDYAIREDDSYLRVEAVTRDTELFLQPAVRGGASPDGAPQAEVRPLPTTARRTGGLAAAVAVAWALYGRRRR